MKQRWNEKIVKVMERVLYTLEHFKDEDPHAHIYDRTAAGYPFICNMIDFTEAEGIDESDIIAIGRWFRRQIPTIDNYPEFFKAKSFIGQNSWWNLGVRHGKSQTERIKFVKMLLKELKSNDRPR